MTSRTRRPALIAPAIALISVIGAPLTAVGAPARSERLMQPKPAAVPPVFTQKPYEEAKALAKKQGKWFIVKATAEWCPPCKQMDKTTWIDAKVVAWVEKNAVAVQLDVDKEPKLAETLKIQAMPTMVAFNPAGAEFDRVVGYRSGADLLGWLDGAVAGKKSIDAVRKKAAGARGEDALKAGYELAQKLLEDREFAKALDEFLTLWEDMRGTSFTGVRGSFMVGQLVTLVDQHKPAKERFTAMRDKLGAKVKVVGVSRDDLDDWIILNEVLSDEDATIAWFEAVKADKARKQEIDSVGFRIEHLLEQRERWADLGALLTDPVGRFQQSVEMMEMARKVRPEAARNEFIDEANAGYLRDQASMLYAACLAANREADALAVAKAAIKYEDKPQMRLALVLRAIKAKQARPDQRDWLKGLEGPEAAKAREALEAALKSSDKDKGRDKDKAPAAGG